MIVQKPLRVAGILLFGALLVAPTIASYHTPLQMGLDVIRTLFPVWFYLLVQVCIEEGRARERADRGVDKQD